MHVFLLLAEKMGRDGVERVRSELLVALQHLQDIKGDATVHGQRLVFTRAKRLGGELCVGELALDPLEPSKVGELARAQLLGAVVEVGQVKVGRVVARDDIRVAALHKIGPGLEQVFFVLVG